MRTFRVWRVQSVDVTDEPARRPEGFDLARTWQRVVEELDARRGSLVVRGRGDPHVLGGLRAHFGQRLTVGEPDGDDGWHPVEIGFPEDYAPAMELAGYARGLEVLGPPEVREDLRTIGARLVERYGR
jgi:predicted DNA-binding transcriptional regulator YafY